MNAPSADWKIETKKGNLWVSLLFFNETPKFLIETKWVSIKDVARPQAVRRFAEKLSCHKKVSPQNPHRFKFQHFPKQKVSQVF